MQNKKQRTIIIALLASVLLVILILFVYPQIEFKKDGKFYACRLSEVFSEFEENASYNELYFYNEKHDVSLRNFEVKNFLFFYLFSFDYIEGDFRETQFMLEETYIEHWLKNAVIEENSANINIAEIIENKTAIVSNKKYSGNKYDQSITYVLDGKSETLYVFDIEGLTVIQVGSPDECPKYIAYQ